MLRRCLILALDESIATKMIGINCPSKLLHLSSPRAATSLDVSRELEKELKNLGFFSNDDSGKITTFRQRCVKKITSSFKCTEKSAKLLMKDHPILFVDEIDKTIDKYKRITETLLPGHVVQNRIWLLQMPINELRSNLSEMEKWGLLKFDAFKLVDLIFLPKDEFHKLSLLYQMEKKNIPFNNRFIYFSIMLKCPLERICKLALKNKVLLKRPFSNLKETHETCLEYGITNEDLMKDITALNYRAEYARGKLEKLKQVGIIRLKPWMIKTSISSFENLLRKQKELKEVLDPLKNREEYLSARLGITEQCLKQLAEKYPSVLRISVSKMKEVVDFLYSKNYTGLDICATIRIFCFSPVTIQDRMADLQTLGWTKPALSIICRNESDYESFLQKMVYLREKKKYTSCSNIAQ